MGLRKHRLFVYGTLRKGYSLNRVLRRMGARYVGKGRIQGSLYDLGEFPGAVTSSSMRKRIEGELYELPHADAQLKELDRIEEFDSERPENSLFVRRISTVRLANGRRMRAWVYFLPRRPVNARPIAQGDYALVQQPRT